ncbi:MAG: 1-acyl-sn-glycerol-3-phosphate acyltransferase, partial [Prevotella sp.]|nr:1-acyl-sn-glycerol-3-phosphate acyltransferase [Prevotella sp.]
LGGVPVYRSKSHNLTDQLAEKALTSDVFHLCITPEGTRSRTKEWKKGFYFIAQKAGIPILLYGIDYKRRLIKCTKVIVPSGNMEKDMSELKDYYKEFSGKNPDQFTTED